MAPPGTCPFCIKSTCPVYPAVFELLFTITYIPVFPFKKLATLFGSNVGTLQILGVALIATLLITAVPIGGGTISEMLIITMLGYPSGALLMLTVVATIIDAPATLLNVVGDSSASMLVARMVEGKNWLK